MTDSPDDTLDYRSNAFSHAGDGLRLDPAYRVFHLPLVNPSHPDAVLHDATLGIDHGRFREAHRSLVAFIPWDALDERRALSTWIERLRGSRLSRKLAWDSFAARRDRLHVTIATLGPDRDVERTGHALLVTPPIEVGVAGPWAGRSRNTGRLYLPCYPEARAGDAGNAMQQLQQLAGLPVTRFFGIGLVNLTDHLTPEEAHELVDITRSASGEEIARYLIREFSLVETFDSLLGEFTVSETFAAAGACRGLRGPREETTVVTAIDRPATSRSRRGRRGPRG